MNFQMPNYLQNPNYQNTGFQMPANSAFMGGNVGFQMPTAVDISSFGSNGGYAPMNTNYAPNQPNILGMGGNQGGGNFLGGLGLNMGIAKLGLEGLNSIGNLWNAFQSQRLANKQFEYTKGVTDTNLNNSIKSYNTALSDRITSRAKAQGMSSQDAQSYLDQNRLSR